MGEVAKIVVSIGGETYQLEQSVGKAKKEIGGLSDSAKQIGGMLAGFFAVDRLMSFAGSIITVRSEFEKYSAVLGNSLGSQKQAADAMAMLQKFAAQTPYQLTELTDSYVKLVNRGLRPSQQELTKVGDFASATGKSFGQLNEAILDANNPERWKEFGIQTKTMGDKVQLTFKGVTMEVERSAAGAMKAVEAFGSLDGVAGTMGAQMDTLGGKTSNLKDNWDMFLNNLGKMEIWNDVLSAAGRMVNGINDLFKGSAKEQATENENTKIADDYAERLKKAVKETGNLKDAQQLLLDQAIAIQNEQIKQEKNREIIHNGMISNLEKIKLIGKEAFDAGVAGGVEKQINLLNKEYAITNDLLNSTKSIEEVLFGAKDPSGAKTVGYIEGLKAKIKDLTEKMEKEPNVSLLKPMQLEINKTKKELDDLMASLNSVGRGNLEIPLMMQGKSGNVSSKNNLPTGSNIYKDLMKGYTKDFSSFRDGLLNITEDIKMTMADAFASVAEGIGEALAGGNIGDIMKNFIANIGGLMASFGKMLIAWGVAQIALKQSWLNPPAAIAAGAALVVIGSMMKAQTASVTGSSQSPNYGSQYGGQGRPNGDNLKQHVEFDIRGDIIRALVRNDDKIVQRVR